MLIPRYVWDYIDNIEVGQPPSKSTYTTALETLLSSLIRLGLILQRTIICHCVHYCDMLVPRARDQGPHIRTYGLSY